METNLPRIAPCAAVQFAGRRVNIHELAPWSVLTGVRGIPRHTGTRGAKQILSSIVDTDYTAAQSAKTAQQMPLIVARAEVRAHCAPHGTIPSMAEVPPTAWRRVLRELPGLHCTSVVAKFNL